MFDAHGIEEIIRSPISFLQTQNNKIERITFLNKSTVSPVQK